VDPLYLDGVSFAASQSATWFNMGGFDDVTFVSGSITLPSPGPWSASVDSYNMGVSGEYWAAQDNWLSLVTVTVDNTSAHGGYLELRDDTGAILDSLAYTEDNEVTRWVGTGSNTATYFIGTRTPMD
jgi:hypothetical protein